MSYYLQLHAGTIFSYGLAQLGYWVTFHAIALSWGILFPFHFRRMKIAKKLKYFHIITVLLALFLPTLPSLIHLNDGYIMANMRTTLCFGRSPAVTFFALILPLSGLMAVATSLLITIFWKILKVSTNRTCSYGHGSTLSRSIYLT
jgi:hypothetical protein